MEMVIRTRKKTFFLNFLIFFLDFFHVSNTTSYPIYQLRRDSADRCRPRGCRCACNYLLTSKKTEKMENTTLAQMSAKDFIQNEVTSKGFQYVGASVPRADMSQFEVGKEELLKVASFVAQAAFITKALEEEFKTNPIAKYEHDRKRVVYAVTAEGYRFRFTGDQLAIGDVARCRVGEIEGQDIKFFTFLAIESNATTSEFVDTLPTNEEEKKKEETKKKAQGTA
jgi:hypothetical protein